MRIVSPAVCYLVLIQLIASKDDQQETFELQDAVKKVGELKREIVSLAGNPECGWLFRETYFKDLGKRAMVSGGETTFEELQLIDLGLMLPSDTSKYSVDELKDLFWHPAVSTGTSEKQIEAMLKIKPNIGWVATHSGKEESRIRAEEARAMLSPLIGVVLFLGKGEMNAISTRPAVTCWCKLNTIKTLSGKAQEIFTKLTVTKPLANPKYPTFREGVEDIRFRYRYPAVYMDVGSDAKVLVNALDVMNQILETEVSFEKGEWIASIVRVVGRKITFAAKGKTYTVTHYYGNPYTAKSAINLLMLSMVPSHTFQFRPKTRVQRLLGKAKRFRSRIFNFFGN